MMTEIERWNCPKYENHTPEELSRAYEWFGETTFLQRSEMCECAADVIRLWREYITKGTTEEKTASEMEQTSSNEV